MRFLLALFTQSKSTLNTEFNMRLSHKVLTKFGTVASVRESDITILAGRFRAHFQN